MWEQWTENNLPEDERRVIMYIHQAWMAIIYRKNGSWWYAGTDTKVDESIVAQIKYWQYTDEPE